MRSRGLRYRIIIFGLSFVKERHCEHASLQTGIMFLRWKLEGVNARSLLSAEDG